MNCIILGDKYQKGMKSKGCAGLININKKTNILQQQYIALKSYSEDIRIIYVYGFDSKKFIDFYNMSNLKIEIIYNEKYISHNQAFGLSLVKDILCDTDTFILDGYIKPTKNIFKKFDSSLGSQVFLKDSTNEDSIGCVIHDGEVENLSFGLDNHIDQIYYLDRSAAKSLSVVLENNKYHNYFLFELLNKLIDMGHSIKPKKT